MFVEYSLDIQLVFGGRSMGVRLAFAEHTTGIQLTRPGNHRFSGKWVTKRLWALGFLVIMLGSFKGWPPALSVQDGAADVCAITQPNSATATSWRGENGAPYLPIRNHCAHSIPALTSRHSLSVSTASERLP